MSKINLVGCDETVDMPIEIEFPGGKKVNFTVQFERMTRKEIKRLNQLAIDRQQETMGLSYKLSDVITIETQLENEKDETKRQELESKLSDTYNSIAIKERMNQLEAEADEDLISRIKGWTGLRGSDNKSIKFSENSLREMMDSRPYFDKLNAAQWEATGETVKN